ncbi:methylated-DNA--[protein]-cysteine S-methyltransferase [Fluviicola sp.]|jgi:AraC family transcriptional regulator of adaptative response/methylated-DNA-[protein]-cysteine methyltransferase|uniref:methylated-DNA--[protein]-cysteine S-methyltransferase n=1 Tax=Fluviicola sp. TaxID=1917219 RepID=UPI00282B3F3E|nr:methylated-DNA--[protein]-cysteine S-methyltransferase [Fluviicola sp.]MDR0803368.1 methylated-DNA--[protein]-cysteine S-methyltransferase [Fluviicola sp.]
METDFSYQYQRMELLFNTLKWLLDSQQIGISLQELAKRMELGEWETQHLFQEYLGKDPLRFVKDAFSPSLTQVYQPTQISIFDVFEKQAANQKASFDLDIQLLQNEPAEITYTVFPYFLGSVFIASHESGICQITFEDTDHGLTRLKKTFPKVELKEEQTRLNLLAYQALMNYFVKKEKIPVLPVSVKASFFQISVWNELAILPKSELTTYGAIAQRLGDLNASRAVGTAVGANPVALLIPCHRVVHQGGKIGHFRWGSWRKQLLLAIEK